MDTVAKNVRSAIMASVKNKDSRIECALRNVLWRKGIRYRKNVRSLLGTPDIAIKKYKVVIFIDSCFWHGCRKHGTKPLTNRKFWNKKILRNMEKDKEVTNYYKKAGWRIIRVWEHDMRKGKFISKTEEIMGLVNEIME